MLSNLKNEEIEQALFNLAKKRLLENLEMLKKEQAKQGDSLNPFMATYWKGRARGVYDFWSSCASGIGYKKHNQELIHLMKSFVVGGGND